MSIDIVKLKYLFLLEDSVVRSWNKLSAEEQSIYSKSYFDTAYAARRLGDGSLADRDTSGMKNLHLLRKTSLPRSKMSTLSALKLWRWHEDNEPTAGKYVKVVVKPDKIRATQSWIDTRWNPRLGRSNRNIPEGIMDEKGYVHLLDGHHRVDYAFNHGKPIIVLVYQHTRDNHKTFLKVAKDYRYV